MDCPQLPPTQKSPLNLAHLEPSPSLLLSPGLSSTGGNETDSEDEASHQVGRAAGWHFLSVGKKG